MALTGRRADDSLYRFSVARDSEVRFAPEYLDDVVVLLNPRCTPRENMAEIGLFFHFGFEDIADEAFLAAIKPFDVVAFSGFPEEHDRIGEHPIVRGGRVASDPRFDFSIFGKPAGRCVAYETQSYRGASGSPVFAPGKGIGSELRTGKLVGINAGHLNDTAASHNGLSYFYKSTVLREMLNTWVGADVSR